MLLYIGRISFGRGIESTIGAISKLQDVDLVLMGNGKPRYIESVVSLAAQLEISARVHVLGAVPHDQVVATAAQADASVVLFENICKSYLYSLPNKLFESIHAGLPVVVSDFPEMSAIVRKYDIGVTCDPSNPSDIADAITQIFSDAIRLQQMKENTKRAAHDLDWEMEKHQFVHIYQKMFNI